MTVTRWLDEDEQHLWRLMLAASGKIERSIELDLLAHDGLTPAEYAILVSLSEAVNHTLRLRELCEALGWDRSRASHQVTRMVTKGYVTKQKCSGDARGVLIALTDMGEQKLVAAVPGHVETVRRTVFDPLEENQKKFVQAYLESIMAAEVTPIAQNAEEVRE